MAYRWKNKIEVDEAVVVVMNSLEKSPELSPWLVRTMNAAIKDSDPALGTNFFEEIQKHAPAAVRFFVRVE